MSTSFVVQENNRPRDTSDAHLARVKAWWAIGHLEPPEVVDIHQQRRYADLLTGNITLTTDDDGKVFHCHVPLTITIPANLYPRPQVIILPPPTGNLSVAAPVALLNGANDTLTRTRAQHPAGVELRADIHGDSYRLNGNNA